MAYFAKGKKQDLIELAKELGVEIQENFIILEIKDAIQNSSTYDEEFTKECLNRIIIDRKQTEEREFKVKYERLFDLEKTKLQISTTPSTTEPNTVSSSVNTDMPKLELSKLVPSFDPRTDDISLFLDLFEKQLTFLNVPCTKWVVYLVGLLPTDIAKLIAQESVDNAQKYDIVKQILLKRFKLSSEKFRQLFAQHRKSPEGTWRDFYFDLHNYFSGWLKESKITTFEGLQDLIIADQIKKKAPPDYREHFLDQWGEWNSPLQLADKLDSYEENRNRGNKSIRKEPPKFRQQNESQSYRNNFQHHKSTSRDSMKNHERPSVSCFGCGKPGFIKAKCPTCSPSFRKDLADFRHINLQSLSVGEPQSTLIRVKINGFNGSVCVDTGASHSIAGETLYNLLRKQGVEFANTRMKITLADGFQKETEVYSTEVDIQIEGRMFRITLFVLPTAKDNRTLLGTDFLRRAGIVLNLRNQNWYYHDNPRRKFNFSEDDFRPPEKSESSAELNEFLLRESEGKHLSNEQRSKLNQIVNEYADIFKPGEEPTPKVKHYIDTGNNPPVAVPPYRMSPVKKEILRKELDELLANGTIEECESPYASPVVLVPKPNGQVRLCVDYRKLNSITKTDKYPLPRIDDLLHEAKHTPFMSTIDLKNGYHQIEVNHADRDKTAFICPFGTFRYRKMPYGLKNAPATFQRMIDHFRNSLENILVLSYLDDIIILSETFDEHLDNLKSVFKKLREFKLCANREKCNFACNRVKYLGHYITDKGLEADPDKVAAIQEMPAPRNVKQVQSFLQTCSWYRRFIPKFSEVARPLTDLTKKNASWVWKEEQETAFEKLKHLLISSPILSQNDPTKPYILRSDASNYAIGAVLSQGIDPKEEHPIEYASRLLSKAERNYSTTEKEALAIVWALNKFRAYIDGQEVTVATDHQPLRWLMNLKSPSGRLARWALQVQSFNLKIEYVPGKANVVADMLSRPFCQHKEENCEICTISIDIPARSIKEIREEQLKDEDVKKIINSLENVVKDEDFANWSDRGYLMNQGVLYRYSPEADSEEAQLVVPSQERERILKEYHDSPTAGHFGIEGTFDKIAKRYYWTGMRRYITEYVKNCHDCCRYKASNQKPSGLLQTPIYNQRFESLSIDLFGPLPKSNEKKWIFIVEDCATKWVELFALNSATAKECAITLIEEVFLRYGLPRRVISDNGPQFVSHVMQQVCSLLQIKQSLTPVYHPQSNPVERKNRDLKPRLAILVGNDHTTWSEKLPTIRFALNTAKCNSTGQTAAYLMFGREPRTIDDIAHDFRSVVDNDNFVPEITPYLKKFATSIKQVKDRMEEKQDQHKRYADKRLKKVPPFKQGDKVWVNMHLVSDSSKNKTSKFMPRRDGPYIILSQRSPVSYTLSTINDPSSPIGTYHISALKPFRSPDTTPVRPILKRGRPPTTKTSSWNSTKQHHKNHAVPLRQQPARKCKL